MNIIMLPDEYTARQVRIQQLKNKVSTLYKDLSSAPVNGSDAITEGGREHIEGDIIEVTRQIKNIVQELTAAIIVSPDINSERVSIGAKVVLIIEDDLGSQENSFIIGGYNTPKTGRYSINAPLIQKIVGAEKGEERDFQIHNQNKIITVQNISYREIQDILALKK